MQSNEQVQTSEALLNLCKVLLDEDRLLILGLLAQRAWRADELAAQFSTKRSAAARLARHLQQLQVAGLVIGRHEQGVEVYALALDQLQTLKRQLFSREDASKELVPEEKTLATFVKDGQLVQLPAQPAKLLLVLQWLAGKFQPGVDYRERDVNELLKGHLVDHVTLRRLLIDHRLLTRQAGIYRRVEEA